MDISTTISQQFGKLLILAIPIACISWTVTHEEIFKEPRDYCAKRSEAATSFVVRKFFYLFTCEYCFSHYVTILMLVITGYQLLFDDWRGYLIGGFSLVWIANIYMSFYNFVRTGLKSEGLKAKIEETELKKETGQLPAGKPRA